MRFLATFVLCLPVLAQTFQIVPSLASRDGSGSLVITLASPTGQEPVALQWKVRIGTEVRAEKEDIVAGDAATKAEKAIACAPATKPASDGLTYSCVLSGGVKPIANGSICVIRYKVKEQASPRTLVVRISDAIAVLQRSGQVRKTDVAPAEGTITVR